MPLTGSARAAHAPSSGLLDPKYLYAAKAGIAAGAAAWMALGPLTHHVSRGHHAWVLLGALTVLAAGPTLGGLISRGLSVLAGAALGAALTVPLAMAASLVDEATRAQLVGVVVALVTAGGFLAVKGGSRVLGAWEYAAAACVLAFDMTAILNALDSSLHMSVARACSASIGLVLAAAAAVVVPHYARDDLQAEVVTSLREAARLIPLVVNHFTSGEAQPAFKRLLVDATGGETEDTAHALFLNLVKGREVQRSLLEHALWEPSQLWWRFTRPGPDPARACKLVGRAVRSLTYVAVSLDAHNRTHAGTHTHAGDVRQLPDFVALGQALDALAASIEESLDAAADALMTDPLGVAATGPAASLAKFFDAGVEGVAQRRRRANVEVNLAAARVAACTVRWLGDLSSASADARPKSEEAVARANACTFASLMLEMATVRLPPLDESVDDFISMVHPPQVASKLRVGADADSATASPPPLVRASTAPPGVLPASASSPAALTRDRQRLYSTPNLRARAKSQIVDAVPEDEEVCHPAPAQAPAEAVLANHAARPRAVLSRADTAPLSTPSQPAPHSRPPATDSPWTPPARSPNGGSSSSSSSSSCGSPCSPDDQARTRGGDSEEEEEEEAAEDEACTAPQDWRGRQGGGADVPASGDEAADEEEEGAVFEDAQEGEDAQGGHTSSMEDGSHA